LSIFLCSYIYKSKNKKVLFMREKKNHLYVDSQERSILLHSLVELKNQLIQQGRYTDCVDELIFKVVNAPVRQNALVENAEREGMKKRISEMQQFLSEQTQEVTEYDEQLVRRLIEKITVYDEWVTVEFKSGTSVKVRR